MSGPDTLPRRWWLLFLPLAPILGMLVAGMVVPRPAPPPKPAAPRAAHARRAARREDAAVASADSTIEMTPDGPVPVQAAAGSPAAGAGEEPAAAPAETHAAGQPPVVYSSWTTFSVAELQSRSNGKPVLVEFSAEWCGPCQTLKREVFDNAAAMTTIEAAVIPVSIVDRMREDGENPAQVTELEHRFGVDAFPTLVLLWPASGRIVRTQGYAGVAQTLRWITESALSER